jgi:molybdate transport system regulatory protein
MKNNQLKVGPHSECRTEQRSRGEKGPCIHRICAGEYTALSRIWIEGKDGAFLGRGRVELLERIRQYGSITEAARSLGMSYRHAWELVDSMTRQSRTPLVETATGGKGGGGARLTDAGEQAIAFFRKLDEKFRKFLEKEMEDFPI